MFTGLLCTLPVLAVLAYTSVCGSKIKLIPWQPKLSLAELGETLFTSHAPAVLALAVLLTAVMIGAALFAREPEKPPEDPSEK